MESTLGKRVLIVQPLDIVRIGLSHIIMFESEMKVCATSRTVSHAAKQFSDMNPDIMVIDATMEQGAGFAFIQEIQQRKTAARIIVLSRPLDLNEERQAFISGAHGIIAHTDTQETILDALIAATEGRLYHSPASRFRSVQSLAPDKNLQPSDITQLLSKRELDVLVMLGQGLAVKELVTTLKVSSKTIETYAARMKTKLGVKTMFELRRLALQMLGR